MKDLMMNEEFSDVTLVTEDKKHIKANSNVLSACSPFFKDILKKEKNSSQIMYLRGIQFSEMESIMQFIYLGETSFNEERIDEFLAVAKTLEVSELCNAYVENESHNELDQDQENESSQIDTSTLADNLEELSQSIDDISKQEPHVAGAVDTGKKFKCEQCPKTYAYKEGLTGHTQAVHKGVTYPCDQCDYLATSPNNLTRHNESKHYGIKYKCDQCDFQTMRKGYLSVHIQSKHEGVKYACKQCVSCKQTPSLKTEPKRESCKGCLHK